MVVLYRLHAPAVTDDFTSPFEITGPAAARIPASRTNSDCARCESVSRQPTDPQPSYTFTAEWMASKPALSFRLPGIVFDEMTGCRSSPMQGTILIADDEPLARRTLRKHLRDLGCASQIHEARDGLTAVALANKERPELIFLDIVMPGATGLEVLEQLDYEPKVIFTTAHDQYAVTAFELGALDYVLKPFGRERLERVLQRAQVALDASEVSVLSRAKEALQPTRTFSRIFVRDGNRIVPIALTSIERVQGADDYATIFATSKEYL